MKKLFPLLVALCTVLGLGAVALADYPQSSIKVSALIPGTSGQSPIVSGGVVVWQTPAVPAAPTGTGVALVSGGAFAAAAGPVDLSSSTYAINTLPLTNEASPTGTGFAFVSAGTWSAAARAVNLNGGATQVTNTLQLTNGGTGLNTASGLTVGNTLGVATATTLGYAALNLAGGAGYVANVLPIGNEASPTGTGVALVSAGVWAGAAGQVDLSSGTYVKNQLAVGSLAQGTAAQLLITNAGATAAAWVSESGDCGLTAAGVQTCTKINSTTVPAGGALTTGQVLRVTGASAAAYGALDVSNASAVTNALGLANGGTGLSSASGLTTGNVLQVASGTTLGYGTVNLASSNAVGASILPLANGGTGLSTSSGLTVGTELAATSGTAVGYVNQKNLPSVPVANDIFADGTNVEFFNTSTTDCGTSASGALCVAPVTTAPTAFPTTGIALWNSGEVLNTTAKGLTLPNFLVAAFVQQIAALPSTAGATTNGVGWTSISQPGQAGTSGSAGGNGGLALWSGGVGGTSDTAGAGNGGIARVVSGAGAAATSSGTGGNGGATQILSGPGGTSSTGQGGNGGTLLLAAGAAGAGSTGTPVNGIVEINDHTGGQTLLAMAGAGLGLQYGANTISTTTGTVTPTAAQASNPLQIVSASLSGNLTINWPNQANSFWYVEIDGVTFNAHNLVLGCGTGATPVTITTLTTNQNILFCKCTGSNVMVCNL